jgi:hypothetical protein
MENVCVCVFLNALSKVNITNELELIGVAPTGFEPKILIAVNPTGQRPSVHDCAFCACLFADIQVSLKAP